MDDKNLQTTVLTNDVLTLSELESPALAVDVGLPAQNANASIASPAILQTRATSHLQQPQTYNSADFLTFEV